MVFLIDPFVVDNVRKPDINIAQNFLIKEKEVVSNALQT